MRLSADQLAVDGYVRVSSVGGRKGERFISPAVQRELIESWATMRGARVLEIFEELDQSGVRADRPLLEKALRRVESGISDGIVVSKVDRFGRSLLSGLAAIERVRVAGGRFVAVEDGLDTSTDSGRLVVRILLSLGEWESERLGASWRQAHARAVRRGVYSGSGTPVGYRRTRSSRLRPDPVTGDRIAEVFRRRANGETAASLARWLEAQGVRTARGSPSWTSSAMGRLLRNRVYLGEVRYGSHVNERAHPALVDAATWQAAQYPRRAVVSYEPEPALLAGLVRCAGCSMTMSGVWARYRQKEWETVYRCDGHSAAGRCAAPASICAAYLEPYVEECVFDLLRRRRAQPAVDLAQAERAVDTASAALTRYRDSDQVLAGLGVDAYVAGLAARGERVRRARLRLAALRDAHFVYTLPPVSELERRWIDMSDHERRAVIAQVLDCVFVSAGRLHVEDRVTLCRPGTAPRLPRTGNNSRGGEARPFTPHARHRLPAPKRWSTKRIERELTEYLHGCRTWPTYGAFAAAGRRRLYDQVERHAGVDCWAHHFGLPIAVSFRSREPWTEARIRAGLKLYLRRKRHWPTEAQFQADGLSKLHQAVRKTGGTQRWSAELSMLLAPNQRRGHRDA
jgi:DNA invertase Pin-like site-specific DNA recombinase